MYVVPEVLSIVRRRSYKTLGTNKMWPAFPGTGVSWGPLSEVSLNLTRIRKFANIGILKYII